MPSLAVPLDKAKTQGHPFFMVSGLGGHVITFQIIAKNLSESWNAYGLMYPGFIEESPHYTSVEAIAARMLPDVLAIQSKGPYFLAGYSMGGLVCLEIANQLTALGEVATVIMMDVKIYDHAPYKPLLKRLPTYAYWKTRNWIDLNLGKNKKNAQKIREGHLFLDKEPPADLNASLRRVIIDGKVALNSYKLRPTAIATVLIRCRDLIWYDTIREWSADYAWSLYSDLREVVVSPGDHMNLIKPPNVKAFAQNLEYSLNLLQNHSIHQCKGSTNE